ncbi:hypothetical protein P152DRAFT_6602 [Eremomyces bilateralis CBS 781.70]|uniref:DUF7907 domain-containing protein n=1 Tax=Eremomyces bilateralis CBS 781.70 TaxID=1392243 RepID=A0A6G1GG67_9PEZI|nr:uncharacterized protein P152DRAFT_6602 [Eremomyces bilateralis CBS 781.70]KAF1817043.1 hypothetical protein P152DRAFT_6602 [Eremomyces bilateralis CBS 781.70]
MALYFLMVNVLATLLLYYPTLIQAATFQTSPWLNTRQSGEATPQPQSLTAPSNISFAYLITKTSANENNTEFSDHTIWAYHNGAGIHAAVATTLGDRTNAMAWFNESGRHAQFDFGAPLNATHNFPFGMYLKQQDIYGEWGTVQIDPGLGSDWANFTYDEATIGLSVEDEYFGGWLICHWYLGVPQLFWIRGDLNATPPTTCGRVNLFYRCHDGQSNTEVATEGCYLHPPRPVAD